MRKVLGLLCVMLLVFGTVLNVQAVPLKDLFDGASIVVDDKIFSDWEPIFLDSSAPIGPDLGLIDVTPIEDDLNPGLRFTTGQLTVSNQNWILLKFRFSVATLSGQPLIKDNSLEIVEFVFGGDEGLIEIEETVFDSASNLLATKEVFANQASGGFQLFDDETFPPQAKIYVENSIGVFSPFGGDLVGLDVFEQRFTRSPALVGYWNFDENTGTTAYDSSVYGNDGQITGASWVQGACGSGLSFDGGSDGGIDYVVVPNSQSINTSTFTVSFWVSISDLDETMIFLHKRNGQWWRNFQISYNTVGPNGEAKDYLKVKIDNGTLSNDFDNAAYAEVNLEIDRYYYVVGTYDQDKLKLYLDGIKIAEHSIDMTGNVGDGDLYIGTHDAQYLTMNPTHGVIDEVRIHNYARTQEQIREDMEACTTLFLRGNETLTIQDGDVYGKIVAYDNSKIYMTGGSVGGFVLHDESSLEVYGGSVDGVTLTLYDDSTAHLDGGVDMDDATLTMYGNSVVTVSGQDTNRAYVYIIFMYGNSRIIGNGLRTWYPNLYDNSTMYLGESYFSDDLSINDNAVVYLFDSYVGDHLGCRDNSICYISGGQVYESLSVGGTAYVYGGWSGIPSVGGTIHYYGGTIRDLGSASGNAVLNFYGRDLQAIQDLSLECYYDIRGFWADGSPVHDPYICYRDNSTFNLFSPPTFNFSTLEVRVSASANDAEERAAGEMDLTSSDLELIHDADKERDQTVGIRFNGIDIPPGAKILDAYIQFQVDETSSEQTLVVIEGEATDNALPFDHSDYNISTRARTRVAAPWAPDPWTTIGEAGANQRTPNLAPIIQEIVDRPGWSSGNSLAFILTGRGRRVAESYNGDRDGAPLLYVKYGASCVSSTYYRDADGDGYGDPNDSTEDCSQPAGYVTNDDDCDDNDEKEHPNQTWYKDADGDGYSDGITNTASCTRPVGYKVASELVATSGDCDDADGAIHPGGIEICNGKDDDCDGKIDEDVGDFYYRDADGDGYGDPINTTQACSLPSGYVTNTRDCDDTDPNEHPNQTWYKDLDSDGYSDGSTNTVSCTRPVGFKVTSELTATSGDCDDSDQNRYPGAPEACNGEDDDCDGETDEGCVFNNPPEADAGPNQTVVEGETVKLDGSKSSDSDPGDNIASYQWTQLGGIPVTLSDPTAVKPKFVTPIVSPAGMILTFELVVKDKGDSQDIDQVTITVNDNGISGFPDDVLTMKCSTGKEIGIKVESDLVSITAVDPATIPESSDKPDNLPYGLFDLLIKADAVGGTAKVTFYLESQAGVNDKWSKHKTSTGKWEDCSAYASCNAARDQFTITLVDGGDGDDGPADGWIVDPSGLSSPASTSTSSGGGGGGGGCFIVTATDG